MADNITKLDRNQIEKMSFDEETNSKRVYLAGGELSVELDAEDGDSIIVKHDTQLLPISNNDIIDLSRYSKICLIGASSCKISAIVDNQEILLYNISQGDVKEICLKSVKIELIGSTSAYLSLQ